MASSVR